MDSGSEVQRFNQVSIPSGLSVEFASDPQDMGIPCVVLLLVSPVAIKGSFIYLQQPLQDVPTGPQPHDPVIRVQTVRPLSHSGLPRHVLH